MNLGARLQGILLKPKDEWVKIKEESLSVSKFFSSYVLILALIPAVAQFLRYGLIGFRVPYLDWYRFSLGMAFLRAILIYGFVVGSIYVIGFIINALAPTFSSTQNLNNAMSLAVYSMTPYLVGSILYLIPFLGRLDILVGLYGIYILYLGFMTNLVDAPKEKVISYLIVSIVVAGVLIAVVWAILDTVFDVGRVFRVI